MALLLVYPALMRIQIFAIFSLPLTIIQLVVLYEQTSINPV